VAFHADRISFNAAERAPADRREALFQEPWRNRMERWALGTAWALVPSRIGGLPGLAGMFARDLMAPDGGLPDPESALNSPYGLAGIVHDFTLPVLVDAHRHGLYPFAHVGPQKWWSPPERSLLFFHELHIGKTMRRVMRQNKHTVTFDRDFEGVITACAGSRAGRWNLTWITPKIMRAYAEMFDAGHAHSFEVWNERNELVGGGYGVAVGCSFVTESQFSHENNTSKLGFTVLNYHLAKWGFTFNDGKQMTPTTRDMGFRLVPRADYLRRLDDAARMPGKSGRWQVEADLSTVAEWKPSGH
jgi:leucyl/phenylalanyl-tRNA--protein transferase